MIVNIAIEDMEPKFGDFSPLLAILREFPDAKFNLFIPVNSNRHLAVWRRTSPGWSSDITKHPGWCKAIGGLSKGNFEVALHGYYHQLLDKDRTPEFLHLSKSQAMERIVMCEDAFECAGIPFVKGFLPPRWKCSKGTIDALEELGYLFYAQNPLLHDEVPHPVNIPEINFNTYINGREENSSPYHKDKYRLFRGHYHLSDWSLMSYCKYLIVALQRLRGETELEFKFYSEIADCIRQERGNQ